MKCDDYRKAIGAEPAFDGGAGHLSECQACQDYRRQMQSLDLKIRQALAIDVPELAMPELADVEPDNVVVLGKRRRPSAPTWFAMAATVAVAAILGVRLIGTGVEYDSLGDEILAHLDHDPAALRVTDVAVADERLRSVVPANIASIDHTTGLITYAQSCEINGRDVPHLVIQGETGPVTILLMPKESVGAAVELRGENVKGVILPVGDGSIAIVGGAQERLEKIEQEVMKSVTWTT